MFKTNALYWVYLVKARNSFVFVIEKLHYGEQIPKTLVLKKWFYLYILCLQFSQPDIS